MDIQVNVDPSETDVEAHLEDTPSGVRLVHVRFGAIVLHMDAGTWVLAKHAVTAEARRLNSVARSA